MWLWHMYLCILFTFWAFNCAVSFYRISCFIYQHLLQARFTEDMQAWQHTRTAVLFAKLRKGKTHKVNPIWQQYTPILCHIKLLCITAMAVNVFQSYHQKLKETSCSKSSKAVTVHNRTVSREYLTHT